MNLSNIRTRLSALIVATVIAVPVLGQNAKVSVSMQPGSLKSLFAAIERQTPYRFSYASEIGNRQIASRVNKSKTPVSAILKEVLPSLGLEYTMLSDNVIAVSRKNTQTTSKKVSAGNPVKVSGKVVDSNGDPLTGATISVEGTKNAVVADVDGNYSIHVLPGQTLRVSFVGMSPTKIKVKAGQTEYPVTMKDADMTLEQVVVVGYGTQKKVNLTGAVAAIEGKTLEDRSVTNLSTLLQGTVSGVNISTSSNTPGSSSSINIRGVSSINSASPLVLIDGTVGDINSVNPNDVKSISVIKDASAAAVYGARAAFGVILVTTKSGEDKDGMATIRYNGRAGWTRSTTSNEYETTGYWSVYLINKFWQAQGDTDYIRYDQHDMEELLLRVNDKTENPERPWVVTENYNGKKRWKYYANTDWYHELYDDNRFQQKHNLSLSGGIGKIKYFVSGAITTEDGMMKVNKDKYKKYNLRANIDFPCNKWISFQNTTSFFGDSYSYQADGSVENNFLYAAVHALACYPLKNPDGSWIYDSPYQSYKVANGRHIIEYEGLHPNIKRNTDFTNMSRFNITPIKQLTFTADFTYRFNQGRNTQRGNNFSYRLYPEDDLKVYDSGAGQNDLGETVTTYNYYTVNGLVTYKDTFKDAHNLTVVAGYNYETRNYKRVYAYGQNIGSETLDDLNLIQPNDEGSIMTEVGGGQNQYSLQGYFGRINYDYKGKYLFELSGRYDGSSRFAKGHRWGFFPSGSAGWRFSEEKFFEPLTKWWSNGKIRLSYGSLGNQNVDYYTFLRLVSTEKMDAYFGEGTTLAKKATIAAPIAGDLTWEKVNQWDLGFDFGFFNNRLNTTIDLYIRDTKDMLTDGIELPSVYGASVPKMNIADLRTKGWELSAEWNDSFNLFDRRFTYSVGANISDYDSEITKYDNENKSFAKSYYEGMKIGELWGYVVDGFFKSDEEAQEYASRVDLSSVAKRIGTGWQAGDVKYIDVNGDGIINTGANTVDDPGDRVLLGNQRAHLQYGFRGGFSYVGIDFNIFFQGTGNHVWYPNGRNQRFWGCYSYPYLSFLPADFKYQVWREDNQDSYFPRPMGYGASGGTLSLVNSQYLQNARYLRLKNVTVGYTLPQKWTSKAHIDKVRVYFTGENLFYWSPMKKNTRYVDPEDAINRTGNSGDQNRLYYPTSKTFMFGLDVQF